MSHDHRTGPMAKQRLLKHRVGQGCCNKMELESLSNPTRHKLKRKLTSLFLRPVLRLIPQEAAPPRKLPNIQFRVLIAGRANAGKTSILQRVCETTESPEIYRTKVVDGEETREKIDHLGPTSERGQHTISDELIFANHRVMYSTTPADSKVAVPMSYSVSKHL
ncbi:hypothetical protein B0H17DRAFT_546112 [Mycena rosella]|uniref:G domain-containing protein n=1 Tax=Mycena rosella TaxID=1033263 RepID=A0AAD7DIC0_MYCRO|nr:hypothetical protein B0H17DRAFT_546112 [Mycena rosella]